MKITRNDILTIAKRPFKLIQEQMIDDIDYLCWVTFIENNREYFVWYEETPDGINAMENIDKVPSWATERVLYSLNKKNAYSTKKLTKNSFDLIISYSESDKRVNISIEKNLTKDIGERLLLMAKHLDALLLKDGKTVIDKNNSRTQMNYSIDC